MIKIDLEQPSTWRGAVYLLTGAAAFLGLSVDAEVVNTIIASGLVIAGMIGVIVPDTTEIFKDELHQ